MHLRHTAEYATWDPGSPGNLRGVLPVRVPWPLGGDVEPALTFVAWTSPPSAGWPRGGVLLAALAVFALRQDRRSADAAEVTAKADRAEDLRRREPQLSVRIEKQPETPVRDLIYCVDNDGPADLDSVVVYQPILADGTIHPVARTGEDYGPIAEIGPIVMGTYGRFTFSLGPGPTPHGLRVRIVSMVGDDSWTRVVKLPDLGIL